MYLDFRGSHPWASLHRKTVHDSITFYLGCFSAKNTKLLINQYINIYIQELCDCPKYTPVTVLTLRDCPRIPYLHSVLKLKISIKSCWLYWHCVTVQVIVWLSKFPLLTLNVETSDKHEELLFVICFVWHCVTVQVIVWLSKVPLLTINQCWNFMESCCLWFALCDWTPRLWKVKVKVLWYLCVKSL